MVTFNLKLAWRFNANSGAAAVYGGGPDISANPQ